MTSNGVSLSTTAGKKATASPQEEALSTHPERTQLRLDVASTVGRVYVSRGVSQGRSGVLAAITKAGETPTTIAGTS